MTTEVPVLYSFRRCPYAIRARLALAVAGCTVELREIVLRNKPADFLATSPSATVPCMKIEGQAIDESVDIMLWALERNDAEGWLLPERGHLSDMMELIATCDGPFKHHLDRYKYDSRYDGCVKTEEREAASRFVRELNELLTERGWLSGGRAALADYAILPFIRQFANADRDWFDAQPWPNVIKWLVAFEAGVLFGSVMKKWTPWQQGDDPVYFPEPY